MVAPSRFRSHSPDVQPSSGARFIAAERRAPAICLWRRLEQLAQSFRALERNIHFQQPAGSRHHIGPRNQLEAKQPASQPASDDHDDGAPGRDERRRASVCAPLELLLLSISRSLAPARASGG